MAGTVLVTGGAKRIGREIVTAFANAGWHVIIHCNKSVSEAEQLLESLGGHAAGHLVLPCDFTDLSAVSRLIPSLHAENMPDCLVNCASEYTRTRLENASPDVVLRTFTINAFAPIELMRSFAASVKSGVIINITDQRTASVDPDAGPYGLAKKSLRDATEAFALEFAPRIRVNAVAPGLVMSPPGVPDYKITTLLKKIPMQQRTDAAEIAAACLYLASSPNITGQTLFLDGGMHLQGYPVETGKHGNKA